MNFFLGIQFWELILTENFDCQSFAHGKELLGGEFPLPYVNATIVTLEFNHRQIKSSK